MKKFWASWYSGNYADEGCTKPPFKFWVSGSCGRENDGLTAEKLAEANKITGPVQRELFIEKNYRGDQSICAVINAETEDALWDLVKIHFPDYRYRFCEEKYDEWSPGDRFQ